MADPDPTDPESVAEREALLRLGLLDDEQAGVHRTDAEAAGEQGPLTAGAGRTLLAALSLGVPDADPPDGALDRLLHRARQASAPATPDDRNQVWKAWTPAGGEPSLHYVARDSGGWEETGFEGIRVRRLSVDPGSGAISMLVRMAAGTSYPGHRHGGAEECFVLEGDIHTGDVHMHAGDYQRAAEGSLHGDQWTEGGCLLLIHSSQHDEFV